MIRNHFEDAVIQPLHGQAERQHLVGAGEGAGHVDALQVLVEEGAGGGKAEGPGRHALAHQGGHLADLACVGRIVGVAALAEHIGPDWRVRHVHADVDGARHRLERVEVFREALPLPVDALGQRRAGDVLDPLHQLDQELVLVRPHRRETDAAIAHDRRRHPVPGRGSHLRIPGGLAVIVGVDVDPARGDDQAGRVDFAPGLARDLAHRGDPVAVHRDVALASRAPPCRRQGSHPG